MEVEPHALAPPQRFAPVLADGCQETGTGSNICIAALA
jgi:hypothetical protein